MNSDSSVNAVKDCGLDGRYLVSGMMFILKFGTLFCAVGDERLYSFETCTAKIV